MRRLQYKVENVQGKKKDDGEAVGGNTGVKDEHKGGNMCVFVVLL